MNDDQRLTDEVELELRDRLTILEHCTRRHAAQLSTLAVCAIALAIATLILQSRVKVSS